MLLPLVLPLSMAMADVTPIQVDGTLCHPRNLFVQADSAECRRVEATGARVLRSFPEIGYLLVEVPDGTLQRTRQRLQAVFGGDRIDLDRAGRIAYTPNDPLYPKMWHPPAINADKAWDVSLGSKRAMVAILDTGVQYDHEDLAANVYTNPGEIPDNGIDDDGNGYVDDVHGYDFVNNDNDPSDDNGHGTGCAGLAAGVGDNGLGITGIAPRARILPLKVANSSGYFYASATIPAYFYGQKMGAKVYSMSYFADGVTKPEGAALKWAAGHGVLPIAAAGNDASIYPFYPGAYECVMSVAALNPDLSKAGFSDYGTWVDVSAPGVALTTTQLGGGYTEGGFSGTSAACPVAAGLAALLYGIRPAAKPATIRRCIEESAMLQTQDPFGEFSNYGMIDAQGAVALLLGATYAPHPPKVRWISPIGSVDPTTNPDVRARVYGRNLADAYAEVGGVATTKTFSAKDYFEYRLPTTSGAVTVKSGGGLVATLRPPLTAGYVYPMIEGSEPGGSVYGGYAETLKKDGKTLMATPRGDGVIALQCAFKNLPSKGGFWLVIDHQYPGATTGTERLELYDWASWSYPYASFIALKEQAVPTTMTRTKVWIPNIHRYVDFEGSAYFRIVTSSDLGSSQLQLDTAYLRPG